MTIADTIRRQIGNQALAMMGAYHLTAYPDAFAFKFKGCRKANYCKVTLDEATDTYTVELHKIGRAPLFESREVFNCPLVYADSLHTIIEAETGLRLSL